ncbi:hypothetical protein F4802DRAFT_20915 [Xylaria palmicola]|nr:hypothetical protein F4802DRAFT_20915 [Xylaria palmicola]
MAGATTFTVFNNFPSEIRAMIWEEYTHTPRVIRIFLKNTNNIKPDRSFKIKIDGAVREQACALLAVCRESRYYAMKDTILFHLNSRSDMDSSPLVLGQPNETSSLRGFAGFAVRSWDILLFAGMHGFREQGHARIQLPGPEAAAQFGDMPHYQSITSWVTWVHQPFLFLDLYLENSHPKEAVYFRVHRFDCRGDSPGPHRPRINEERRVAALFDGPEESKLVEWVASHEREDHRVSFYHPRYSRDGPSPPLTIPITMNGDFVMTLQREDGKPTRDRAREWDENQQVDNRLIVFAD